MVPLIGWAMPAGWVSGTAKGEVTLMKWIPTPLLPGSVSRFPEIVDTVLQRRCGVRRIPSIRLLLVFRQYKTSWLPKCPS